MIVALVLEAGQPNDPKADQQQDEGRPEKRIDFEPVHGRNLPSVNLATKCKITPIESQATHAKPKITFEVVAAAENPKKRPTTGATTPVTMIAAASVLSQAAVSLIRSL